MSTIRILVTGSRDWDDRRTLISAIVQAQMDLAPLKPGQYDYNDGDWTIIHGACPTGADEMADEFAVTNWMDVERYPADWDRYGRAAGPIRNKEMVDAGADICLAFIKNGSAGATNCFLLAEKAGIPVRRYLA